MSDRMKRLYRRKQYVLARPATRIAGVALAGLGLAALAAAYAVALWKMPDWLNVSAPRDRHTGAASVTDEAREHDLESCSRVLIVTA